MSRKKMKTKHSSGKQKPAAKAPSIIWPSTASVFGPFTKDDPAPAARILLKTPQSLELGGSNAKARIVGTEELIDLHDAVGGGPVIPERVAYVFFEIESLADGETTIGCGADYWMQWWVNGKPAFDTLPGGNGSNNYSVKAHQFKAELNKGTNCLVVKVRGGGSGFCVAAGGPREIEAAGDWRRLENGNVIPTKTYSDQPFIVTADDGAWVCCVTTCSGEEGDPGQHIVTMRSFDRGKTWSEPVAVEPADGPEASYAVMLKAPSGRIFIFYNHNTDRVPEVKSHDGKTVFKRVDSLGHFVLKYSDDHGKSWSKKRFDIPFRLFDCDRENVYGGKICFFWNVGRAFTIDDAAYVPLIKIGKMGRGFFAQSEGTLLRSPNLLTAKDLSQVTWETLPEGDIGLRTPPGGGPISEEQSYTVLSDKSIYAVYRTIDGHPVEAYSRDGGRHWTQPRYMQYPDGSRVKHPRAANFVWRCENGKFLYWFHNHGGRHLASRSNVCEIAYNNRNPVWVLGGVEADSPDGKIIRWGQPDILLYNDDPLIKMSYPDLAEADGEYYVTETQKTTARVHKIPKSFLEKLWNAAAGIPIPTPVPRLNCMEPGASVKAPGLPVLFEKDLQTADGRGVHTRRGFGFELRLRSDAKSGILLDGMNSEGNGFSLDVTADGRLELFMGDGQCESRCVSEPLLKSGIENHLVVNVDGGPGIVSFIANGKFCDGGDDRQFGWSRYNPWLQRIDFAGEWKLGGAVKSLRLYGRPLLSAEALTRSII
ncbi:MAG: sialidase family protein [Spirochaetota bacterium]